MAIGWYKRPDDVGVFYESLAFTDEDLFAVAVVVTEGVPETSDVVAVGFSFDRRTFVFVVRLVRKPL